MLVTASLISPLSADGIAGATSKVCDSAAPAPAAPTAFTDTWPDSCAARAVPARAVGR
jgi:hypothetical protein